MRRRLFLALPAAAAWTAAQDRSSGARVKPELPLGYGIARIHVSPTGRLHFYNRPAPDQMPSDSKPVESVQFGSGKPSVEIRTAPPWFVPEVLKMDYETLLLRVVTIQRNWAEVIVNSTDAMTHWISRDAADVLNWPEFLLGIPAVEPLNPITNPLRIKPLDHASEVQGASGPYSVIAANDQWLEVRPMEGSGALHGWMRWTRQGKLLVSYSILS